MVAVSQVLPPIDITVMVRSMVPEEGIDSESVASTVKAHRRTRTWWGFRK